MSYCMPENKVRVMVKKNGRMIGFDLKRILDGLKIEVDGRATTLHVSQTEIFRVSTDETIEYTTLTISVDEVKMTRIIIEIEVIMMD